MSRPSRMTVFMAIVGVHPMITVILQGIHGEASTDGAGDTAWRIIQILDWPISLVYSPTAGWLIAAIGTLYWMGLWTLFLWIHDRLRGPTGRSARQRVRRRPDLSGPEAFIAKGTETASAPRGELRRPDPGDKRRNLHRCRFRYLLGGGLCAAATLAGICLQPWEQIWGAREDWDSVSGNITKHLAKYDATQESYLARVCYCFVVGGQTFHGVDHPPGRRTFSSRREARRHLAENLPVGCEIEVFYDPSRPRHNGLSRRDDFYIALIVLLLASAAYAIYFLARAVKAFRSKPLFNARRAPPHPKARAG